MKNLVIFTFMILSFNALAESPCDIRPGTSSGVKVIEFATGNKIHSKILLRESSADALLEEMVSLQDMGICEEKIYAQKCILKFEKFKKTNYISLYRGKNKWNTWQLKSKDQAFDLVKKMKKVGFCS
jgi:hypothetical protein